MKGLEGMKKVYKVKLTILLCIVPLNEIKEPVKYMNNTYFFFDKYLPFDENE